jgi:hypothetical protein
MAKRPRKIERSTTEAYVVDGLETGKTKQHGGGMGSTTQTNNTTLPR